MPDYPVIVARPRRARRAIFGALAGAVLVALATTAMTDAMYSDSEYTNLPTVGAGSYDLQISPDGSTWSDTIAPGASGSDNIPADTQAPLTFSVANGGAMLPGTTATTSFWVRNAPTSTTDSTATLAIVQNPAADSSAAMLAALSWAVVSADGAIDVSGVPTTALGALPLDALAPGASVKISVSAQLTSAVLASSTVAMVARVSGASTTG
ncbi:hypothetical protein ACFOYW_12330 [Gryllotalpicola reticulitermitis]|uniref:Ribosomally synthesized peptide with SipW-like signal peptide n=1 Tax=Gryllotalpicola reticulitermitis TaxID=1184153 RepID=A0ABV8Q711_9MICO